MRDTVALLKLIRLDLEAYPPPAPIVAVHLSAEPGEPRATQNHLFLPPAPEPARLELTLARIAKLVGGGNAGSPELLDTHRPDAFALRAFRVVACHHYQNQYQNRSRNHRHNRSHVRHPTLAPPALTTMQPAHPLSFRVFRPPLCAEVECSGGRPARLWARGIRGNVVCLAGPWRTSGEWWTAVPWEREEWDVEVEEGVRSRNHLYRIYRDLKMNSWHIAGSYD
jgi:protein ImuB